ncbi:DNA polymerase delta subunit 2 [Culicoides brevitarsis]|uniref:DNA polymerase delta subunit 2 n=1 Tax=Culicoides brevitarsis TaxID=469753 RepID=UPI00307C7B86
MESVDRIIIPYENRSEMFHHSKKEYKQYAHVYSARLKILGDLVKEKASKKWSSHPFKQLFELREEQQETCIIIGTLFKHQALKPNILKEVAEEEELIEQPLLSNYVDEQDKLILEDDLQRIRLTGKIEVHKVVTGVVCAVLGYVEGDGKFIVEDVIYNESGPQAPLKTLEDDLFVILISGISLSNNSTIAEHLDLLKYWLYGCFGSSEVMDPKSIVRVIIAGNSINAIEQSDQNDFSDTLSSVQQLDTFISDLTLSIPVDLMPGETDPTNLMLPQQPLHACMLPKSRARDTFCSVSNPYRFKGHDRLILGTSGQNVADILRFSTISDEISALKATLEWSHIAPTAPDTLPSYPYYNEDPFILNEMPHVYFAGNCKKFETQEVALGDGKTRIICVPSFAETKQVVLLNLKSLECKPMSINFDEK